MAKEMDQEFLEFLIKSLVDTPDAVQVERKVDEMGVLLTLKVDAADMGKIIGRAGNTAKAIRSLLRVVGIKNNARVNLKIEEPEGGRIDSKESPVATEVTEAPVATDETNNSVDSAIDDLNI